MVGDESVSDRTDVGVRSFGLSDFAGGDLGEIALVGLKNCSSCSETLTSAFADAGAQPIRTAMAIAVTPVNMTRRDITTPYNSPDGLPVHLGASQPGGDTCGQKRRK